MTQSRQTLKYTLLGLSIGLGVLLHSHPLRADTAEAIFAGGCFWCVESDFEQVPGVIEAVSGFAGGETQNPTYKEVGRGGTGHLEAVKITFDDTQVSYGDLLYLFIRSIDPLDNDGQFCDRGESYTPAIFALDDGQRRAAEAAVAQAAKDLGRKSIRVPVRSAMPFYPAEAYHQDFYKSQDLILTRFGPQTKATAYKKYRKACGRDDRVKRVWGENASFTG